MNRSILVAGALVLLAGCGTDRAGDVEQPPSAASAPTAVEPSGTSPAPPAPPPPDPSNASPTPAPPPPDSGNASPPPAETLKLALTPALPEGPYYPAESQRPSDRDADLLLLTGSPAVASGQPIVLQGQLLDMEGKPVTDAVIEIWQADSQGIYLHPDDPRTNARDPYFQSYGEVATDDTGSWTFRTIAPAVYEDRPQHIHLKVQRADEELLTTQVFFADDPRLADDPVLAELEGDLAAIVVSLEAGQDNEGRPVLSGRQTLVVDLVQ